MGEDRAISKTLRSRKMNWLGQARRRLLDKNSYGGEVKRIRERGRRYQMVDNIKIGESIRKLKDGIKTEKPGGRL